MRDENQKPVGQVLAGASEVNGSEARNERHNRLNGLRFRLQEYLDFFSRRDNKGPSLKEMVLIVKDMEACLAYIKKYDQE